MKTIIITLFSLLCFTVCCAQQKIPVPLPALYDGHFYLKGNLNDSLQGNFVFDTGADGIYLDSLYLERTKLPLEKVMNAVIGGAGTNKQQIKVLNYPIKFHCGSLSHSFSYTPILQLKPILGKDADGIVGYEYLRKYIVEFCYEKQSVRILPPDSLAGLTGFEKIPMVERKNRLYVTLGVSIDGKENISGEFLVDLGSGGSVTFTSHASKKYPVFSTIEKTVTSYTDWGGVGGGGSDVSFRSAFVTLGSFQIREPLLNYSLNESGALSSKDYIGLLGNDMLERFDVIFDFPNKILYIKPNKDFNKKDELAKNGFGYVDRTDICDGFIVRSLYAGQNAEKAGVKIGDIITQLDGRPVKGMTKKEVKRIFNENQTVLLTIQRGGDTLKIQLPLVQLTI